MSVYRFPSDASLKDRDKVLIAERRAHEQRGSHDRDECTACRLVDWLNGEGEFPHRRPVHEFMDIA